jgi:hypothetical protein
MTHSVMSFSVFLIFFFTAHSITSILEVYDIITEERTVVKTFDYLIEAPNWSPGFSFFFYFRFLIFFVRWKILFIQ